MWVKAIRVRTSVAKILVDTMCLGQEAATCQGREPYTYRKPQRQTYS